MKKRTRKDIWDGHEIYIKYSWKRMNGKEHEKY
jgi:hypothetical protein